MLQTSPNFPEYAYVAKNKDYHKKLYRLVRILNRLETEGKVTPRELADEFNVSMRTAQRDIELINMAEFPLLSLTKGVYSFMPGFTLKRLPLSNEEASLLAFLCEVASSMGKSFSSSFRSLLSKATLTAAGRAPFHAISPVTTKTAYPAMQGVSAAIEASRKIEVLYATGKTHRLRPLKVVYSEGFWYLVAQVDGMSDFTTFRLDRISSVKELDETFTPPKRLVNAVEKARSIWAGPRQDTTVVLKIAPDVAEYFESAAYFPRQRALKRQKDGTLLVETRISHFMEVIPVIQRWIPHVRVVRPIELRRELEAAVRGYLKK